MRVTGEDGGPAIREVALPDEEATRRLAEDVAAPMRRGDLVVLSGGLGSGKTTFARAAIRALARDPALNVPSPTFPLRIDYPLERFPVVHADLYRIGDPSETAELGLEEAVSDGALIVEWGERLPAGVTGERLDIALSMEGPGRRARLAAHGAWTERLGRTFVIRRFLELAGWGGARRMPIVGDASARQYERLARDGDTVILMNAPERPPGPPVQGGRSYDDLAKRARAVGPFIALARALRAAGVHAPDVSAYDLDAGLVVVEDLGSEPIADEQARPFAERYEAAIDLLAAIHGRDWTAEIPSPGGGAYRLPPYDREALLIEVSLFADWYAGHQGRPAFGPAERARFLAAWSDALAHAEGGERTLVLRDFHSVNILWVAAAEGLQRVGVIDFQDALIGHPAYDVASLAQDARAEVPPRLEAALKARYMAARRGSGPIDRESFEAAYAVLGLQRATKILGAFSRLAAVEGKTGYRRHIGHVLDLVRRNLAHPVLSPLRLWYQPYL